MPMLQVLMCPTPGCQDKGCPGQLLTDKDVPACGIDTATAAVGSTFRLLFQVGKRVPYSWLMLF